MHIEVLYPEVCNLYGDTANMRYLAQSIPEARFTETSLNDIPSFVTSNIDMVYMGPMTEGTQKIVIERLAPYKSNLNDFAESGKPALITGNALEIFTEGIETDNGEFIEGLGMFEAKARRDMKKRFNSLYLGKFEDFDVVGFKNQFSHSYAQNSENYFLDTIRGSGLSPENKLEGLRKKNFIATYLLGPILILNPLLMSWYMNKLGSDNEPAFCQAAMTSYKIRLKEFKNNKTRY